ncbi:hypothetical protein FHL15_009810 [Xylaria flabelliformis]|uniref:Uncharacterized protein n=1 Tax=Xylaria flabelliformis TaxID=2512241 RepID=A0A553HMS9_9PEZI|nr:hypothetical protein FHL15_009810 [Xylaria flabelliformis]
MSPSTIHSPLKKDLLNFRPDEATPEQLQKACYPPRPDKELTPKLYALWKDIAAREPQAISTKLIPYDIEGLAESRNWSGAILPIRREQLYDTPEKSAQGVPIPPDERFNRVTGSWTVPNLHPLKNHDGSYRDGEYAHYSWIGLDGWQDEACLKIGVESKLLVEGGQIKSQEQIPAILFVGPTEKSISAHVFEGFKVEPGDLLSASVWGNIDGNEGCGSIINQGRNEHAGGKVVASKGVFLRGRSAEWVAAGRNPDAPHPHPFPNYGATVFFNGLATSRKGEESISRAMLVDAEDVDSSASRGNQVVMHSKLVPIV